MKRIGYSEHLAASIIQRASWLLNHINILNNDMSNRIDIW